MTGEEWLERFCQENNIDFNSLSLGDRFQLTRKIPCTVRCARIGAGVFPLDIGERCPECGALYEGDPYFDPKPSWDRLTDPVITIDD